ncbi:MAG: OmpH family outer membrane protein [Bacteroidales bacterium]|nr:OmpH family outer membrane protein [Bacteroidales bacterium]
MKRIVLIAVAALVSFTASAQNLKFAYVDFTELVQLMPEMDQARATLEENSMANEEILVTMYEEYQKKGQEYQQKASTWTQAVREIKEKELMDIQSRLEQTQQSLQMELQQLQNQLQAPVVEKAQQAVEGLAKAKGVAGVFEKSSLLYIDEAQMIDLTPEARVALNIPEGRTLEQLQQELAAKAQAAQQGM